MLYSALTVIENLVEWRVLNEDGTLEENTLNPKETYVYDEQGRMIDSKIFSTETELLHHYVHKYSNNKGKEKFVNYYKDNRLTSVEFYDDKGLLKRKEERTGREDDKVWKREYKFDHYGNWIVRIDFVSSLRDTAAKKPEKITERIIEYYHQ